VHFHCGISWFKKTFCRNVEEYLCKFLTNNPAFVVILTIQRLISLTPMIAAAIPSIVFFDDAH